MTFGEDIPQLHTASSGGSSITLSTLAEGQWFFFFESSGAIREIRSAGDNQYIYKIPQWVKTIAEPST